uniref:UDP-arabinopyranose mutase 5 n=1 Tax=Ananas comosus var. bracteatus TaxID=296719 RepID=A0A6V7QYV5_ANACO
MSLKIKESEVDIVIAALRPDLTAFLEAWRPFFSPFHIIIVKDPDMEEDLKIPPGFDLQLYTKSDMEGVAGATSINFSGHSCRYFGYLISRRKYIISIDDDCFPAKDSTGVLINNAVAQHLTNLENPATPFFFNTLYDPYREGTDFVRGYPFSLRNGVDCVLSCGLLLNVADYDSPTQAAKPSERNARYVDAVLTVPIGSMMPVSGINIAFNREALGPALLPGLRLPGEGKRSGLPYVWRNEAADGGSAIESLKREWEGVKLMEEVVPFFQSVQLQKTLVKAEDCVAEIAAMVREKLGSLNPAYAQAATAMEEWVNLWKALGSQGV